LAVIGGFKKSCSSVSDASRAAVFSSLNDRRGNVIHPVADIIVFFKKVRLSAIALKIQHFA